MEKSAGKAGPAIAQQIQHWLKDDDFAGVRAADALTRLPETERKEWQKLWQEVEALQHLAAAKTKPQTNPNARRDRPAKIEIRCESSAMSRQRGLRPTSPLMAP